MKDSLKINKNDLGKFELTREIVEVLDEKTMDKRIEELDKSKLQLTNEIDKGKVSIQNMQKELERIERNKALLLKAKKEGNAEYKI